MERLHKDILKILKRDDMKITISDLKKSLLTKGYNEDIRKHVDYFKSRVIHSCDVLERQGLIIKQAGRSGSGVPGIFVGITNTGRDELDLKFRVWRWVKDDFQVLLSVIALATGLLAFFGMDWDWFTGLFE